MLLRRAHTVRAREERWLNAPKQHLRLDVPHFLAPQRAVIPAFLVKAYLNKVADHEAYNGGVHRVLFRPFLASVSLILRRGRFEFATRSFGCMCRLACVGS